ncbi:MAG: hypothetical protein CVU48_08505 [Candidatus Cloacimonetes bacterium HGW-Cloacimonetes-1]|jgi:lipopolysaccharide export system permease protein|nr:MAG: hypothetical protein CVU48_08505 [Candidatus Cloacimonetes bacterium HGW-Cloacimonetes-1]
MKILKSYILKEHVSPFFLSLLVVTFVLLIDRIIDLLNIIIEKKLDFWTITQVFGLSLPFMLALSIPMAVLVATILAFGRMTVDRETIAMKTSGVNIYSMIGPLLVVAMLLTGLMIYFNHYFLPESNHKLKNMMIKIAYYKPMTIIKENEFNNLMDYTIFVKENTASLLKDILIYDRSESRFPKTISAKSGKVIQMDNGNSLQIVLNNGEMHERNEKEPGKYQVRSFEHYVINIRNLGNGMDFFETGYRNDREMNSTQLVQGIADKKKEINAKQLNVDKLSQRIAALKFSPQTYDNQKDVRRLNIMKKLDEDRIKEVSESMRGLQVEYHKKYAISFAVIIFVLIGIPLGLMTRSSGIGMAFSFSSVIFLIYYVSLTGGEQLADKGIVPPFIAMWISNIVFLIFSLLLINASMREKRLFDLHLLSWRLAHLKAKKTEIPQELIH